MKTIKIRLTMQQRHMLNYIAAEGRPATDLDLMIAFGKTWKRSRNAISFKRLIQNSRAGWTATEEGRAVAAAK